MTDAKQKANELMNKFYNSEVGMPTESEAKNSALIAVDEILNSVLYTDGNSERKIYWQEVKRELQKL